MNTNVCVDVRAPRESVLRVLSSLERVGDWVSGLERVSVQEHGGQKEVELVFATVRPAWARVQVEETGSGIRYVMVEGAFSALSGEIAVESTETGSRIRWVQDLFAPVNVPGALVRELEKAPEGWLRRLGELALDADR